jgi:hypothetical protein
VQKDRLNVQLVALLTKLKQEDQEEANTF